MTSPVNNFQDILDAMERNPALRDALRRHILTDELLQIPVRLERVEEDISAIKGDVATVKEDVSRIGGNVSNLMGSDYESHVATYIHRSLRRELKINATVFSTQKNRQPLIGLLDEAEEQGMLTKQETDKLNDVDIVLKVNNEDEYILGEISITIQQDDVRRATEWATILAKATGGQVTPIAIGAGEDPDLNKGEVQVILVQQYQET